jgi:hypothetical protein
VMVQKINQTKICNWHKKYSQVSCVLYFDSMCMRVFKCCILQFFFSFFFRFLIFCTYVLLYNSCLFSISEEMVVVMHPIMRCFFNIACKQNKINLQHLKCL